jgi:signal transduction histidine kinase
MSILGYKYKSGSPLPSYVEELIPAQLAALRVGCLLAAPLLLAFSVLDRAVAPALWLQLLGVRVLAAALLLLIARQARTPTMPVLSLSVAGNAVICGTIELAIFGTGTFHSPYLYAPLTVLAGLAIVLPLRTRQALVLNLESLLIVLVPLLLALRGREDDIAFAAAAAYLISLALLGVTGAGIQDRLRRREHQTRAEFARHAGLLNLGTLAGGLAHELSNPLNALFLQADMVARDPTHALARVEKMRGNMERMRDILEAMRNGARLSGGERRPVALGHEVDLAFTLIEGKLRDRVAMVRAYAELPPVYCQPTLLGQVLVNLLANAADAVSKAAVPRIALRVRREGDEALVEVEDNGGGVPAELRRKIFEPFFSTKGDQGNGLGLWISSEIARLHGGTLTVHEGSSGGALFRLALPIDPRGGPPALAAAPEIQPAA